MPADQRPSKLEAFLALLREGRTSLHLDARRPGVVVPVHLRREPHLVLQYGYDLPIPIPDLTPGPDGVRATLSFGRVPHVTVVPWSAVYVVRSDQGGVVYQEDVPDDLDQIERTGPALPADRALRSVPAESRDAQAPDLDSAAPPLPPRRRRRPQLRLVK